MKHVDLLQLSSTKLTGIFQWIQSIKSMSGFYAQDCLINLLKRQVELHQSSNFYVEKVDQLTTEKLERFEQSSDIILESMLRNQMHLTPKAKKRRSRHHSLQQDSIFRSFGPSLSRLQPSPILSTSLSSSSLSSSPAHSLSSIKRRTHIEESSDLKGPPISQAFPSDAHQLSSKQNIQSVKLRSVKTTALAGTLTRFGKI
jgi:hypothetical protein